ncbi:MAG: hypothetical protein BCS36_09930 [Desulfovibrio sp. MES5]|nr:MAG: hypothetical protein BCS36_09930 [Desulfovibrio sp. MES5]
MLHVQSGKVSSNQHLGMYQDSPLSALDETTLQILRELERSGDSLVEALETRLEIMQEAFMAHIHSQVEQVGLKLESRLLLYLSPEGKLVVEGNDADAEGLCRIIAQQPSLQRLFQQMAHAALLSHGLSVASQAQQALAAQDETQEASLFSRYHMCLKGPLSHFYIR